MWPSSSMLPITWICPRQSASGWAHGGARAPCAVHAPVLPLMDQPSCEIGVGGHLKGVRPGPQVPQGAETIPLPDILMPEAVVAFASGVGGGLPLGRKDRDESTDQTQSDQLPQIAGMEPAS